MTEQDITPQDTGESLIQIPEQFRTGLGARAVAPAGELIEVPGGTGEGFIDPAKVVDDIHRQLAERDNTLAPVVSPGSSDAGVKR